MPSGWWAVAVAPLLAILIGLLYIHQPFSKAIRWRSVRAILIVLGVIEVVSFLVPTWWPALTLDGTDPQATACAEVGDTISRDQWSVTNQETGRQAATASLRFSTKCGTAWVKVENVTSGTHVVSQVRRPAGGWLLAASPAAEDDELSPQAAYSMQIRSTGCVYVSVKIMDADKVIGELDEQNGCSE